MTLDVDGDSMEPAQSIRVKELIDAGTFPFDSKK
jgi:hypothetical protein